ncbi:transketolase [Desulfomonile tiedjei]|uniref:Transketolase n=1 Tax=Desulfomonile tiedjei (strain ATCC 49306 / DSM 6799 / DCB-1) TaxID=706587 RepID=I4C5G9_DESTA|nr:transketolase [Desulfomonile tiedjei]AFM24810.1 transketolase [Desulfomonile tiedjei DSM 6799]
MGIDLDQLCINTLRFLAVDMVEKANSGHPGLPLGSAPIAYVIWDKFLKYNPTNPSWPDRDRFVLSAGHGCALLYAMLHVTGFDLSLDEIKQFRQWGSKTPGHPEYRKAPGVEATTGPLGQGLGNAIGMAMAEAALAAQFNKPDHKIVDHYTYVMVSDGDLMEGLSSEAGSLAGHLRLSKLIVCYCSNKISIEGSTDLAFTENCRTRFDAFGWHTQLVGNPYDLNAVHTAIEAARLEKNKPSFIEMRTHIGYGSPHKQDSSAAHGEPLGEEEVRLTKENLGWPTEPTFYIPDEALTHFRKAVDRGKARESEWKSSLEEYEKRYPDLASEFRRRISGSFPEGWDRELPSFKPDDGPIATRSASGKVINVLAPKMPELIGGAADLAPSTKTLIKDLSDFQANDYRGRNLRFGVREHIMGAAANGIALHGGFIPYVATFLIFSDYMRPSMRLAALTELHVIYVFTHDSIGLGEDGPTHQPIEQLVGLRAIPNFVLIRPADANETAKAWQVALKHREGPVALALTRQNLPVFDLSKYPNIANGVEKGGYIISDSKEGITPDIILVASGSEVQLILQAQERLLSRGVHARAVSMPSWNLFDKQDEDYRNTVFTPHVPILAVEAGATLGWRPYVGPSIEVIGVDRFGASAPGETVLEKLGFSVDNVCNRALNMLGKGK